MNYTILGAPLSPFVRKVRVFCAEKDIAITGQFSFKGLSALFIRDPDRNVIEFDEYAGTEPDTRTGGQSPGYADHP